MSFSDYAASFRNMWRDPKNRFDIIDAVRAVLIIVATMALATAGVMALVVGVSCGGSD
jgi:hypothetical protein